MKRGDRAQAKLRPGLGNWSSVVVVTVGRDTVTVERNGTEYEVPRRRVRPMPTQAPKSAKVRTCSYCKEPGHDIRNCGKLTAFSKSIKSGPVQTITRPFITDRPELEAQPKPPAAVRSDVFLDFVRAKPCMWCGRPGPSDPDHVGPHGLGQKTDDLRCIPSCRTHHDERHDRGRVRPHTKDETMNLIYKRQVDLLVEFARTIGGMDG
jgi:hypothetical protein